MKVSDYMAKVKNNNPRVHEISKDINVSSKDLIALLESYGVTVKNHMTVLENREIDIILTTYLNKYDKGDTIEEYYASVKAEKETQKPKGSEEKATEQEEAAPAEVEITEESLKITTELNHLSGCHLFIVQLVSLPDNFINYLQAKRIFLI